MRYLSVPRNVSRSFLASAACLALIVSTVAAWPARASGSPVPPAGPESASDSPRIVDGAGTLTEVEQAQLPLVEAADEIQALVDKHGLAGFAGVAIDLQRRSVTLSWKGELPRVLATELRRIRADVDVEVVPVPYSLAELDHEARRIAREHSGVVAEVGPTPDFRGLRVAVKADLAAPAATAAADGIRSHIPLTFDGTSRPERAMRWDDISPFWGGNAIDRLVNPILRTYVYCTTAFAGRRPNGQEVLITARHCGTNKEWRTPLGDRLVGTTENGAASLDATVLTGGDYSPLIYVGNYQSIVGRVVVGAGNPAQYSWVFPSGSWSGASVVQVTLVNQYVVLDGQVIGPGFFTEHPDQVASVGEGDSGGPVAQAADLTTVNARGMISAVDRNTEGPCQGLVVTGRVCAWRAYHVNITQIANALNFTVMTSMTS
jgi:streptogrisin D